MMKRLVNFRPLFVMFLSLIGGIFCIINSLLTGSVLFFVCALIEILLFVGIFVFNHYNLVFKPIFLMLIVLFGLVVGNVLGYTAFKVYSVRVVSEDYHSVSAQINELTQTDQRYQMILNNVKIDGTNYSFNLYATLDNYSAELGVNDEISFSGYFYSVNLKDANSINSTVFKDGVYYNVYVDSSTVNAIDKSPNLVQAIKLKSYENLRSVMTEDNANFCYALLFGDKTLLNNDLYQSYKNSGLAHTLCVSGLHVGILIAIAVLLLNKLKIKKKNQFFILAVLLFVYCLLCNFSAPMIRSSLMGLCLLLSYVFGERADSVSSLSLAGILLLLFQPLYLFDVGFLLSFSSIFGILFLCKTLSNLLQKLKMPKMVSDLIALTISAQIGTLPFIAHYFNVLPIISVLSNLIVLPIFTIMFVSLFVVNFLVLIVPLSFLLLAVQFLINSINSLIVVFGKVGTISIAEFGILAGIFYYLLIFSLSNYFMLSFKSKMSVALIFVILTMTFAIYQNTPVYYADDTITTISDVENTLILTTQNDDKILFGVGSGDVYDYYSIKHSLISKKIYSLSCLIVANYTANMQDTVSKICNEFKVSNLIVPQNLSTETMFGLNMALNTNRILQIANFEQGFEFENINLSAYYIGSTLKFVNFNLNNLNFSVLFNKLTSNQIQTVLNDYSGSKIVFVEQVYSGYESLMQNNYVFISKQIGLFNSSNFISTQNYNLFTISNSFDKLVVVGAL